MEKKEIENQSDNQETETQKLTKKKKPLIVRFFLSIFAILGFVIVAFIGIGIFCALDKKDTLSVMPKNFSFYVKTDSAYDTFEPMLDLQAADIFFATPELKGIRPTFMSLRSSELRKNVFFKKVADRSINAAVYEGFSETVPMNFLASLNLGAFSFVTRPLFFIYPKIETKLKPILKKNKIEISLIDEENVSYFELKTEGAIIYFSPAKNLVIASDSKDLLKLSLVAKNEISYSDEQKKSLNRKVDGLQIITHSEALSKMIPEDNAILKNILAILPSDKFSVVNLKISESDIYLDTKLPISLTEENKTSLDFLLSQKSTMPELVSKMTDIVQYYTILNLGTLEELQKAVFPILPVKNPESLWAKGNVASKVLFSMDLNEMLFSWSGKELAVLGIENQNDPVFAIQVVNEKKRQEVFDKIIDSIFIKDDNSLILGGVRLPKLKLPSFLSGLMSVFGVNMPEPYFLVHDGYIYFSESPEALSSIFTASDSASSLMKTDNWNLVSSKLKKEASVSLFYNLERSIPFFLRSNSVLSKILELYKMGRFDVEIYKDEINFILHANAVKVNNTRLIAGFPIPIGKNAQIDSLTVDNSKNPSIVFWADGKNVNSFDLMSLETLKIENIGKCEIVASKNVKDAVLWIVNQNGNVFLCNKKMELLPNFPVSLNEKVISGIEAFEDGVLIPLEDGSFVVVYKTGSTTVIPMPEIKLKSKPTIIENTVAVYDKSFFGSIYFVDLKKHSCINQDSPFLVEGIGFGSPAMIKKGSRFYTAFITQSGLLSIWDKDLAAPLVSKQLESIFEGRIVASKEYFYAISTDAILYRIDLDGNVLSVKIPNATAKNAYLSVQESRKTGKYGVYVNADSNVIYGFNENLELLSGFPLVGSGNPVFADVNGDKKTDLVSITIDKSLIAWELRQ